MVCLALIAFLEDEQYLLSLLLENGIIKKKSIVMKNTKNQSKNYYTASPATDSLSDTRDIQSVSLVENVLSTHGAVVPNLQKNDKTPNTDGTITVYDDSHQMLGKLEVQVKTLASDCGLKFDCPTSTLAYCEDIHPMLWFFVDNVARKIYWLYIDCNYLSNIEYRHHKTKRIELSSSQFLSVSNKTYIDEWRRIVLEEHEMRKRYSALKAEYEGLSKLKNTGIGAHDENFAQVHRYLDELNAMYDVNFPIIKQTLYPGMWKMGIAYSEYESNRISYALYPIMYGINDVQIKKFKESVFAKASENGFIRVVDYRAENPIHLCPDYHARITVKHDAEEIIKTDALDLTCNDFLMIEYIFAVVDRIGFKLALQEAQQSYSIADIRYGIQFYAPIWLEEQYNSSAGNAQNRSLDVGIPRYCIDINNFSNMNELRNRVNEKIGRGERPKSCILVARNFNIHTFTQALEKLSKKYKVIHRPYIMQRFNSKDNLVVNTLSKESAAHNMKKIIDNLPECYDAILKKNFTGIEDKIGLLHGADLLLFNYNLIDQYAYDDVPTLHQYYLQCKNEIDKSGNIKVVSDMELERYPIRFGKYENKEYKIIRSVHSALLNTLYTKTPLLNLIKELLSDRLKDYFSAS